MAELWKSMGSLAIGTQTNNRTYGFVFMAEKDLWITHLGIYAPYTGEYTVLLWDNISDVLISTVTGVSTANNWSYFKLDEVIEVKSGKQYTIAYNHPSNGGATYYRHPNTSNTTHFAEGFLYIGSKFGGANNVIPTSDWGPTIEALGICGLLFETEAPVSGYKTYGTYTSNLAIIQPGQYRVRWSENKPAGTNITLEYTTGEIQEQWQEVSNGDIITSDTNLWIRATLSTEDTTVTPVLKDLWLEEASAPQDKILITMQPLNKFNNVEGDLTVNYDATKGNLTGAGGAVESFEVEFTPTDLVQTPNPGIEEHLMAYPYEITLDFKEIDRQNRYAEEHLKAYPYEIVLDLKHVSEINP